ncbi:MAG: trimethylamine methyltransferase family protein, partial [Pseudomonadota bacterium]
MARRRRSTALRSENQGPDYTQLTHGFPRAEVFSHDHVAAIHAESLRVLEELGIRILNEEARNLLESAGCEIRDDMMVHFPTALVEAEVAKAPRHFRWHG